MSRNFELLYQVGRAGDVLGSDLESQGVPPVSDLEVVPVSPQEGCGSTPALQLEGMAREEITKLVHRLFHIPSTDGPRNVVFTGLERGDGCSWICAHVAEALASQVKSSVCVVDCNFRFPALHQQFGTENHFGLSDALVGEGPIRNYAHPLSRPNLWLVSCGASTASAEEFLLSERMRRRLSELRSEFRHVLVDVGLFSASNNAMMLGGFTDGIVMVLKANSTRRDSAQEVLQQLQASNVRILGAVLNQRRFPIPERVYRRLRGASG